MDDLLSFTANSANVNATKANPKVRWRELNKQKWMNWGPLPKKICPKSTALQKYSGESMWCNNHRQRLVDLRTLVYLRYFVIWFTDFPILWDCTLGRRFILLLKMSRVLLIFLLYRGQGRPLNSTPVSCQGHLSKANVYCHMGSNSCCLIKGQPTHHSSRLPLQLRGARALFWGNGFCSSRVQPGKMSIS